MKAIEARAEAPSDPRPAVAHLVTPYLFATGSWIHAQVSGNPRFRAVVMTQATENLDVFPFQPVYDFSAGRGVAARLSFALSKYLMGRFPIGPYREAGRAERVRLVHAHLGWEGARAIGLRRALGVPFITSFYGRDASMIPRKAYWRALYKRLFREGDLFIAEGSHMAGLLAGIGCPREKIRVVHLGVDLDRIGFAERLWPRDGNVIGLIAASFREKKGIPYALEAVARVASRWPGLRIRVIGDGPMRPQIAERIARPDLKGKVDLLGYLDYPSYIDELGKAHFLLSPSVTAVDGDCEGGAPVCLLDAQASGLPILATTHCDIPETIVPGRSALLAPERDVEALASNLDHLLAHPEEWPVMGRAGREHVGREYEIGTQGARMAALYEEAIQRAGVPSRTVSP